MPDTTYYKTIFDFLPKLNNFVENYVCNLTIKEVPSEKEVRNTKNSELYKKQRRTSTNKTLLK